MKFKEQHGFLIISFVVGLLLGFAIGKASFANDVKAIMQGAEVDSAASITEQKDLIKKQLVAKFEGVEMSSGDLENEATLGSKNAPVTLYEYSDYQCPFCSMFYKQTLPSIIKNYVKAGKVKVVFRDFPLSIHKYANISAQAAYCAGDQDAYWYMHDLLFDKQSEWASVPTDEIGDTLVAYAELLELDTDEFSQCIGSQKYDAKVKANLQAGRDLKVTGTPSFVIGNQVVVDRADTFAKFQSVLDPLLK